MDWQEYQEAVALHYEQKEGKGSVCRNIFIPDKVTGQRRQVDVLIEIEERGHKLKILIDAKYRKEKLDVKDIEEVLALADAVGASKAVIVAANGWTRPAEVKAKASDLDLQILTLDEADDIFYCEYWEICPRCEGETYISNDHGGMIQFVDGMLLFWTGGQCNVCKLAGINCFDCGITYYFDVGETVKCYCGHRWSCNTKGLRLRLCGNRRVILI